MSKLSQLVFYGEILPGHDGDAVREKLAALLKLSADQIPAVFSGRKIVLRKNLPSEQGPSYVARLEKIGVKAFVESMAAPVFAPTSAPTSASISAAPASAAVESLAPSVQAAVVEEMDCPKCGERQPKRTLCRACSVDMKRFAEAQQAAEQQAREERMLAREITRLESGRGARIGGADSDRATIFGFGFSGRLGRRSYLIACLLTWAIAGFAAFSFFTLGVFVAIAGLAVSAVLSARVVMLRCHDINWSGWFWLIMLVPYVGILFAVVLLFMPGSKEENNYGAPPPAPGVMPGLAVLALCILSMGLLYRQQDAALAYFLDQMASQPQYAKAKHQGAAPLNVAEADVEMFTTSDCGVCHMAKAYMDRRGITYAEKDVEKNEAYLREFYERGGRGVPYIFVGEQSMMGFDAERLEQMLAANRT